MYQANRYLNSKATLGQYLQTRTQISYKIVEAKLQVKLINKILDQAHRLEIHNKFSSISNIIFLVKINKTSLFLTILVLLVTSNSTTNNSIPWANLWGKTNSIKIQLLKLEILRKVLFTNHSIWAIIRLNSLPFLDLRLPLEERRLQQDQQHLEERKIRIFSSPQANKYNQTKPLIQHLGDLLLSSNSQFLSVTTLRLKDNHQFSSSSSSSGALFARSLLRNSSKK